MVVGAKAVLEAVVVLFKDDVWLEDEEGEDEDLLDVLVSFRKVEEVEVIPPIDVERPLPGSMLVTRVAVSVGNWSVSVKVNPPMVIVVREGSPKPWGKQLPRVARREM